MTKKKVFINGKDRNDKQIRKSVEMFIVHPDYITERAFQLGFTAVTSYRYFNTVSNEWMTIKLA